MKKGIVVLVLLVALPAVVWAQDFSNAKLYQMIKNMERKFDEAIAQTHQALAEAQRAKAEAAAAREEAARAKQETARVKAELARVKASAVPAAVPGEPSIREAQTAPGWQASVEMIYMRPSRDNLDYVILDADQAGPNQVSGSYMELEPGYHAGNRLGLNYHSDTGAGFRLQYTMLDTTDRDFVSIDPANFDLWGTWIHPNAIIDDNDVTSAGIKYNFDMDVFDLSAHKRFNVGRDWGLGVEAGLRYARLNQDVVINYRQDVAPALFRSVDVYNNNQFIGYGPRFGMDVDWRLGKGVNLFSTLAGSLLVGDLDLSLKELDRPAGAVNYTTRVDVDRTDQNRTVPVVEMRAGIGYAYALENGVHIGAKAGYELQKWFNMATNQRYTDDVDGQLMNTDTTDLSLDGFFLEGFVHF